MTRLDLIDILSNRYPDLTLKDIDSAVKTIISSLEESMKLGKRVEVRGFGSFSILTRKPRVARNPKSGDIVLMQERKVPIFRAGKELRNGIQLSK